MSAYQTAPLPAEASTGIPLVRLVKVELRKSVNTLASFWLIAAIGILMIMLYGLFLVLGLTQGGGGLSFTSPFGYTAAYVLQPALAVLAIMLVTSEWGQRTAMVTFCLEPRRQRVLYAKLLATMLLAAAIVTVVLVVGVLCLGLIGLSGDDVVWDFGVGDLAGLILFELIAVVMGYALATLILNTPAAIVAFPVLVYVVPLGMVFLGALWGGFADFSQWINPQSSFNPIIDWSIDSAAKWGHLIVCLVLWVGVPLVVGQTRVLKAEVK